MTTPIHVLGISGSLRKRSFNTSLLRAAGELLPDGMTLETFDLAPIPMYNQDEEEAGHFPESVLHFKERIAAADALIIATPEYNFSVPGVLKNAIDWASRPIATTPFSGKPLAIMSAGGRLGGARAQYHLRQICAFVNLLPLNKPEVFIIQAQDKFDAEGRLIDEPSRKSIRTQLEALVVWTNRLRGTP